MVISVGVLIAIILGCAVVGVVIGFFVGMAYRKKVAEAAIGSANQEATRIVNEAVSKAESVKKEKVLEAKDEIHKQRSELEREIRERRSEVQRQERRMVQKEESLDKKIENLEKKEEALAEKIKSAESKEDLTHEKAVKIMEYEQKTKDESETIAREIIATAIQRCAADHSAEATVSVVTLPNDEMKGRIIGREGRNIRTLETITGVDLIIDDTPEAITVSCFDPVRREIARKTLEKLIADKEVEHTIKQTGERAAIDAGVNGIHPELIRQLGKLKYRTSYGQNVLNHSLEVSYIAGLMAAELGADVKTAKRAGLLHDIGKALDHEMEGSHIELGVEYAKKYKENEQVVHAIQAHHGDVEAKTVVACLVQAADAISAARPGARRENLQNYIKRLEKLEEISNSFDGVEKSYAIQAGREIRIMVKPEAVSDDQMVLVARDIAKKIEEELEYPGQIKVNVVRESRAIDFAK